MYADVADKLEESEQLFTESLNILQGVRLHPDTDTAVVLQRLASVKHRRGHLEEAEAMLTQAVAINRQADTDQAVTQDWIDALASLRFRLEKYKEAEPLYVEMLDLRRKN